MIENLQVTVRLRGTFEALDLGFRLLREHGKGVFIITFLQLVPMALGLGWLFREIPWMMPLLIWWLKPLWSRPILHILSRATFGDTPNVASALKAFPSMCRRGVMAGLLWRRLSDARSLVLPLFQLEGQSGASFRRRRAVLLRRGRFRATLLTMACFAFQLVLIYGAFVLIAMLVPDGSSFHLGNAIFESDPTLRRGWVDVLLKALPVVAMGLMEPFYVAGGFGLYLNRRVELEGWDVELAFRRMASRIARLAVGALLCLGLVLPMRAQGQPADPKAPAREALERVMEQPEFQTKKKVSGWHWKESKPEAPRTRQAPTWIEAFVNAIRVFALAAKWVIISAAVALLGWFLWRHRDVFVGSLGTRYREERPTTLMGWDLRPETLPSDVPAAALALWRQGEARAALALLYRASLAELVNGFHVELPRGATERECLRSAARVLAPDAGAYFRRLTHAWQGEAYAGQRPEDGEALCLDWGSHFRRLR